MTKQILHGVVMMASMLAIGFATQVARAADYQVTFTTGNVYLAGTDMDVSIRVYGKIPGKTETIYTQKIAANKLISGNAFERAAVETISFSDDAAFVPEGVEITTSRVGGIKDDWNLDSVKVVATIKTANAFGQVTNNTVSGFYGYSDWMGAGVRDVSSGEAKYNVAIYTGTKSGAGTDANITIEIHGTSGATKAVRLNGLINGNAFENGDVDRVSFSAKDVGDVTGVEIVSDNRYPGSDWYLSKVVVSKNGKPAKNFTVNSWFTTDKPKREVGRQYSR